MATWPEAPEAEAWRELHRRTAGPEAVDARSLQLCYAHWLPREEVLLLRLRPWPRVARLRKPVIQLLSAAIEAAGSTLWETAPPGQRTQALRRWAYGDA